jgi:hypothetical protein
MKQLLLSVVLLALVPAGSNAQSLASPFGTVSQTVDSTTITVDYYRPSVRGRQIFGRLVRWNELWTPGANWATTLEVTRAVRIEGHALPAGKYSLWFIPARAPGPWTVVINRAARRFHVARADPKDDQLRFEVPADSGPDQDLLTFAFPEVSREAATLGFSWARARLNLHIAIIPSVRRFSLARPLSSYTGVYTVHPAHDSTAAIRFEIVERGDALWVRTGEEVVEEGLDPEFDLLAAGDDEFHPRQYKGGRLIGDNLDELITFRLENGRVTGFDIYGMAENIVLARATLVRR